MRAEQRMRLFLMEMFPHLNHDVVDMYVASGDSLDKIVCDITENRPPPITLSVEECLANLERSVKLRKKECVLPRQFNFPEIFGGGFADTKVDPFKLRKRASELYAKAKEHRNKIRKGTAGYYIEEADKCTELANKIRRQASVVILQNMLNENKSGTIDMHNLYVDEAILFLEDYTRKGPSSFVVVTGRAGNSQRMRPAVKKFLEAHRYTVKEDGPFLVVKKKIFGHEKTREGR